MNSEIASATVRSELLAFVREQVASGTLLGEAIAAYAATETRALLGRSTVAVVTMSAALREVERMTSVGPPSPPGRKSPRDHWYDLLVSVNAHVRAALADRTGPARGARPRRPTPSPKASP